MEKFRVKSGLLIGEGRQSSLDWPEGGVLLPFGACRLAQVGPATHAGLSSCKFSFLFLPLLSTSFPLFLFFLSTLTFSSSPLPPFSICR